MNDLSANSNPLTTAMADQPKQNTSTDEFHVKYHGSPPPVQSPSKFISPIRFKDVIDSIPRYDGHKPRVF